MRAGILRLYRVRGTLLAGGAGLILAGVLLRPVLPDDGRAVVWASLLGMALMVAAFALSLLAAGLLPTREAVPVQSPVTGRWLGMNSPATRVPSHGVRAYGQSHAIDLVAEPDDGRERPVFGVGPLMRHPRDYPAFGQAVHSMVDGVVVAVSDGQRDHRARSQLIAVGYMMVEGMLRELGGPRFIVGNHVVVRSDDGDFALIAHLQRGSARVRPGERVGAGQVIAACGNSGNSSEPHVHAQLMDRASLWTAQGVPMLFTAVRIGSEPQPRPGLPANGEHLRVG